MRISKENRKVIVTAVIASVVTGLFTIIGGGGQLIAKFMGKPFYNETRSKENKKAIDSVKVVFSQHAHIEYAKVSSLDMVADKETEDRIAIAGFTAEVRGINEKMAMMLDLLKEERRVSNVDTTPKPCNLANR